MTPEQRSKQARENARGAQRSLHALLKAAHEQNGRLANEMAYERSRTAYWREKALELMDAESGRGNLVGLPF